MRAVGSGVRAFVRAFVRACVRIIIYNATINGRRYLEPFKLD